MNTKKPSLGKTLAAVAVIAGASLVPQHALAAAAPKKGETAIRLQFLEADKKTEYQAPVLKVLKPGEKVNFRLIAKEGAESSALQLPFDRKELAADYTAVSSNLSVPRFNSKGVKIGDSAVSNSYGLMTAGIEGRLSSLGIPFTKVNWDPSFKVPYTAVSLNPYLSFDAKALAGSADGFQGSAALGLRYDNFALGGGYKMLQENLETTLGNNVPGTAAANLAGPLVELIWKPSPASELAVSHAMLSGKSEQTVNGVSLPSVNSNVNQTAMRLQHMAGKNVKLGAKAQYTESTQNGLTTGHIDADLNVSYRLAKVGEWISNLPGVNKVSPYLNNTSLGAGVGVGKLVNGPQGVEESTTRLNGGITYHFK